MTQLESLSKVSGAILPPPPGLIGLSKLIILSLFYKYHLKKCLNMIFLNFLLIENTLIFY